MQTTTHNDFVVRSEGSIVLVEPQHDDALAHLEEHVEGGAQWWGRGAAASLVVEHRYAAHLVDRLIEAGYVVGAGH